MIMKRLNIFKILLFIISPLLILSVALWHFQPEKPFNIYILDKTVPDVQRSHHKSFNWILNHENYTNKDHKHYSYKEDYYGFFPLNTTDKSRDYKIRSLRLFEILGITDDLDMLYYTDTYGVTYQDWYHRPVDKYHAPLIYGGLNQNDYLLLSEMRRKNKLIITEFNMLGSPTSDLIRNKTESLFDFKWTGWTGCYYHSLLRTNSNLPRWIVALYEQKYKKSWEFRGAGILFIKEQGEIVILEEKKHLDSSAPQIVTNNYGQKMYELPSIQNYQSMFDIITTGSTNKVVANYQIFPNSDGDTLLHKYQIPKIFPAIIEHLENYKFYYFAGDFADRNIIMTSSYCKGIASISKVFYWKESGSKTAFFWRFYVPLIHNILAKNLYSAETVINK
jgi:hypothetical protein